MGSFNISGRIVVYDILDVSYGIAAFGCCIALCLITVLERSEEKRKLRYTEYYGDGDSKDFGGVENIYIDNILAHTYILR